MQRPAVLFMTKAVTEIVIHIHEDDWGMRNLYPVAALAHAQNDVSAAVEAGQRNWSPSGGWTDIHLIKAPDQTYADAGLTLAAAKAVLAPLMPRVKRFNATVMGGFEPGAHDTYGSYEEDAHCYGFGADCFVKLDCDGDVVKYIWFEARSEDAEHLAALRRALIAIDELTASAVTDYWLDVAGAVADSAFLDRYFQALAGEEPGDANV